MNLPHTWTLLSANRLSRFQAGDEVNVSDLYQRAYRLASDTVKSQLYAQLVAILKSVDEIQLSRNTKGALSWLILQHSSSHATNLMVTMSPTMVGASDGMLRGVNWYIPWSKDTTTVCATGL